MKIDEELVDGCQHYLEELERRKGLAEQHQRAEQQKREKRDKWRKLLYEDGEGLITVIV